MSYIRQKNQSFKNNDLGSFPTIWNLLFPYDELLLRCNVSSFHNPKSPRRNMKAAISAPRPAPGGDALVRS
jgi:hypothetical protein